MWSCCTCTDRASSGSKPAEVPVPHTTHKTRPSKQRSTQNHSPKSHAVSSPRSTLNKLKHSKSKSGSSSPATGEWSGQAARRTNSITSVNSRESSKTGTPNLSPKSNLSKSVSSGSLNQDPTFDTVELPIPEPSQPEPLDIAELREEPEPVNLVEHELAVEAEHKLQVLHHISIYSAL